MKRKKKKEIVFWNDTIDKIAKLRTPRVSKRYCMECGCDITESNYALICEHCRLQL